MKELVYIAGPLTYGGKASKIKCLINLYKAMKAGMMLMRMGYDVVIPHFTLLLDYMFKHNFDYERWLQQGINTLKRCDKIYFCEGWKKSKGSLIEHYIAEENNIQIMIERR